MTRTIKGKEAEAVGSGLREEFSIVHSLWKYVDLA